jgi:hypothetical protein
MEPQGERTSEDDAQLDAALRRADDLVTASLRREDDHRRQRSVHRRWMAVAVFAFIVGIGIGSGGLFWWMQEAGPSTTTTADDAIPTSGRVEVKWGMRWFPATIRRQEGGLFLVRYDGRGDALDEWVIRERIRAIGSTREIGYARPNPPGEKPELPSTAGAATQP